MENKQPKITGKDVEIPASISRELHAAIKLNPDKLIEDIIHDLKDIRCDITRVILGTDYDNGETDLIEHPEDLGEFVAIKQSIPTNERLKNEPTEKYIFRQTSNITDITWSPKNNCDTDDVIFITETNAVFTQVDAKSNVLLFIKNIPDEISR